MTSTRVEAAHSGLEIVLCWAEDVPVSLQLRLGDADAATGLDTTQPLVEALTAGHGRDWAGRRFSATAIGRRLRYRSHRIYREGPWQTAEITQVDDATELSFTSELSIHDAQVGVRSRTTVTNNGSDVATLHAISSLVFGDFQISSHADVDAVTLLRGQNDWLAEGRWTETGVRDAGLPRLTYEGRPFRTRGCIEAVSLSSWSTGYDLPAGALTDTRRGRRWTFQVEHNGGWVWQVGERPDGLYLALLGPTDEHHQWALTIEPGESFTTVPASITLEAAHGPASLAAMTAFRRISQRTASPSAGLVVFNDYMNTINGDPNAEVLSPLIDAAAAADADVFVIDAGWYADNGDWWDTVGEWQPSTSRFPDGLDAVLDHIRSRGMRPGLWLEPEVVGVNSPMALKLPDDAFLTRSGVRAVDHGRYHLDFNSPAAVAFLDEVVDRLVNDHGIAYFKFDYNIRAGVGTDTTTSSAGHGLLQHNRAYLTWIDALRARHPNLILENCASGGMRADFATTARFDLQSTSDQEDFHAYAPVAAAAAMLVLPEQAGNWAYPQPEMSDADVTFALCTGILGRLYLSGWLPRLSAAQQRLVAEAVAAHRGLLNRLTHTVPFWPLGLPGWDDEWVALGLHDADGETSQSGGRQGDGDELYVTIWRRSAQPADASLLLPSPPAGFSWSVPIAVFPDQSPLAVDLVDDRTLRVTDPVGGHSARVVRLKAERT